MHKKPMRPGLALILAGAAMLTGAACSAGALSQNNKQAMAEAAKSAQVSCYTLIYRDANAYNQCIRNLADAQKAQRYKKLGVEYFGFVGGLAYRRIGQMGAEQSAAEFLARYRKTQASLGVSDADLCASVPGDCETRIAQAREMESVPPKPLHLVMRCIGKSCQLTPQE